MQFIRTGLCSLRSFKFKDPFSDEGLSRAYFLSAGSAAGGLVVGTLTAGQIGRQSRERGAELAPGLFCGGTIGITVGAVCGWIIGWTWPMLPILIANTVIGTAGFAAKDFLDERARAKKTEA